MFRTELDRLRLRGAFVTSLYKKGVITNVAAFLYEPRQVDSLAKSTKAYTIVCSAPTSTRIHQNENQIKNLQHTVLPRQIERCSEVGTTIIIITCYISSNI